MTTTLPVGDNGKALAWLRSRVIDSRAASRVALPSGRDSRVGGVGVDAGNARVVDARLIEEAQPELQRQDPPHRLVDPGLGDLARGDVLQDGRLPLIGIEDLHAHVDAGVDGLGDGTGQIRSDVVRGLQRRHILVVTDDHALETHLLAQDVGEQVVRGRRRNAVDGAGVDHDGLGAGVHGAGVGRQDRALQVVQR